MEASDIVIFISIGFLAGVTSTSIFFILWNKRNNKTKVDKKVRFDLENITTIGFLPSPVIGDSFMDEIVTPINTITIWKDDQLVDEPLALKEENSFDSLHESPRESIYLPKEFNESANSMDHPSIKPVLVINTSAVTDNKPKPANVNKHTSIKIKKSDYKKEKSVARTKSYPLPSKSVKENVRPQSVTFKTKKKSVLVPDESSDLEDDMPLGLKQFTVLTILE